MKNPKTGVDLTEWQVERLDQLRTIRRNATKAARSGNPAKRIPALSVLVRMPEAIRETYEVSA